VGLPAKANTLTGGNGLEQIPRAPSAFPEEMANLPVCFSQPIGSPHVSGTTPGILRSSDGSLEVQIPLSVRGTGNREQRIMGGPGNAQLGQVFLSLGSHKELYIYV